MSAIDQTPSAPPIVPPLSKGAPVPSVTAAAVRPSHGPEHAPHVLPPILPPPQGGIVDAQTAVRKFVGGLGPSLGNVFLIPQPWIGMALWFAVAWNPRHAAFALLGLGIALLGQLVLDIEEERRVGGGLKANALMAAVAAGWMTEPTFYALHIQIGIAAVAAASAFVITASIMRALDRTDCPSLLWGFCITAGTMFVMFPVGTMMAAQKLTWWHVPPVDAVTWTAAFLRSLGSLLFAPAVEAGIVVALSIILWSRAAFAAGVIGWAVGAIVATSVQDLGVPYYWLPASYNYFVAGMAIGAFFILPGYASLLLAALAGAGASLCDVALQSTSSMFAYLPMASAMTIYAGIGTLALARDRRGFWRNLWPKTTPEEAWWRDTLWSQRLGRSEPLLVVPVAGAVQIAQGFDGPLSHTRHLRHALDFVRLPSQELSTADGDLALAESMWNSAVTAPAAGVVDHVHDGVPDNPLGVSNFAESWGNYVTIRLDQGGWALLAHFRQWGIAVRPGARVEIGSYLGAAGNSGRSPVPHLHLQIQDGPDAGARTIPFRMANYLSSPTMEEPLREWHAAKVPSQGLFVMAAAPNPAVHSMLASLSPGTSIWMVEQRGTVPRVFRERNSDTSMLVRHTLDEWGRHQFTSSRRSALIAALAPDAWRVLEQRGTSPFLSLLAHAVPTIPYAAQAEMAWSDIVPAQPAGRPRWFALLLAPYRRRPFTYARSTCVSASHLESDALTIETALAPRRRSLPSRLSCTFDRVRGPVSLEATFDHGSLHYTLVSFTPGLPF